jgi:ribonuclease HI
MGKVLVLRAYTDGSCLNQKHVDNPDKPRYAGIGVFFADDSPFNVSETFLLDNPTNIRAEFFAAHTAMKTMYEHYVWSRDNNQPTTHYKIYIDCKLVIDTFFGGPKQASYISLWKPKNWQPGSGIPWVKRNNDVPKNLDLIIPMYELFLKFPRGILHFVKVKAHRPTPPTDPKERAHWYGNMMADKFATRGSAAPPNPLRACGGLDKISNEVIIDNESTQIEPVLIQSQHEVANEKLSSDKEIEDWRYGRSTKMPQAIINARLMAKAKLDPDWERIMMSSN